MSRSVQGFIDLSVAVTVVRTLTNVRWKLQLVSPMKTFQLNMRENVVC